MEPLPIVEHLDVIENGCPGSGACRERLVGTLRFERGEEALLHGVVIAVAGAAHAGLDVVGGQQGAVVVGGASRRRATATWPLALKVTRWVMVGFAPLGTSSS